MTSATMYLRRFRPFFESFTRRQYSKADNLITLIADDHVFVGHLTVGGMTRLLVVDIQRVGLSVVRQPDGMLRGSIDGWDQL